MIHVATQEDVLGALADGWWLWGRQEAPPKRGYTYWLEGGVYAAKRVSPKIITVLVNSGRIVGARNAYGDLRFQLVAGAPAEQQERLLDVGA